MPKLKQTEINTLDQAFSSFQGAGYVLNFSDRTFAGYFDEEFGIDINDQRYQINGTSKGKRLRAFLTIEDGNLAGRVLRSLWDHRAAIVARQGVSDDPDLADRYFQIVHRLEGDSGIVSTDAIDRFSKNETLDELVAAIQRDIAANKPQAALDRLHTYCMKKFAHLLAARNVLCGQEEALHSRAGKYIKLLEAERQLQGISLKIMKSSISILTSLTKSETTGPSLTITRSWACTKRALSSIPSAASCVSSGRSRQADMVVN